MNACQLNRNGLNFGLLRWLSLLAVISVSLLPVSGRAGDNIEFFDALTTPSDTNDWIQLIDYSDGQGSLSITNDGYCLQASSATEIAVVDSYPADLAYTNCQVSLDVIDWDRHPWPSNFASINIFARAQSFNSASAGYGYLFFFRPNGDTSNDGEAAAGIWRIDPGPSVTFNQSAEFPINANDQYRLVFTVNGTMLTGQIFDLTNLANPVFTFQRSDNKYTASGSVGIFADDDAAALGMGHKPVDFTVNNFRAGPPAPPLNIQQTVTLSWPDSYAGYVLQTASSVDGPWQSLGVTPQDNAGIYTVTVVATGSSQFFRLTSP